MHAVGSPDFSTSLVPIVSWYFNARTSRGGRLFGQVSGGCPHRLPDPRVDGFGQARVHTGGRVGVPSTAVLKVAGSAEFGCFRPWDLLGTLFADVPPSQGSRACAGADHATGGPGCTPAIPAGESRETRTPRTDLSGTETGLASPLAAETPLSGASG